MKILIVSQVIPQWYVDTIKHALGANWQCDIITGSKIKDPIIEAPSHDARSFISRFFCWIKFLVFMRIWVRNNKSRHYDLIFAISNPPINSYIGLLLKRIYNAPFLYMNWDLYPQVIEYGVRNFSGRIVSKVWHKWNNYSYPQIDRMLTIGQVVSESLNRDLKKKVHVSVLPISVDTDRIKPIAKDKNPFVIEYNLTDKFVVLYSGKMGMGHNIELILEASLLLCDYSDVKFVFIGEGPKFDVVKRHVLKYSSKNILLLPTQPEDIFPFSIACGDIGIVSQESEMAHLFMPSKTYSMLACGEAIIGIGSSHDDLKMLIEENKIGFSVVDNQASSIANDIKFLYDNRDLLNRMKETSEKVGGVLIILSKWWKINTQNYLKDFFMQNRRFALDLTWVRHMIVGGTESFVNNLIFGFLNLNENYDMALIVARNNEQLFIPYTSDKRITCLVAPVDSDSVWKRIIWQNLHLSSFLKKRGFGICVEPVYAKPILCSNKIKWVTVIHDLEALHFPQYHSLITNFWLRLSWYNTVKTSAFVICISDFVRNDIIKRYNIEETKIRTIYDPIRLDVSCQSDFLELSLKYGISEKNYYYTVSKLNPHKNLSTLVKVFGEIKKRKTENIPCKLLISGVDGGMIDELNQIAKQYDLKRELVLTGFVKDEVRNSLYTHAKAFLFPSVFEGFGMPLIEAISCGTPVVTTNCACIPEITQNYATYVDNPYSIDEWINAMGESAEKSVIFDLSCYNPANIAHKYMEILDNLC